MIPRRAGKGNLLPIHLLPIHCTANLKNFPQGGSIFLPRITRMGPRWRRGYAVAGGRASLRGAERQVRIAVALSGGPIRVIRGKKRTSTGGCGLLPGCGSAASCYPWSNSRNFSCGSGALRIFSYRTAWIAAARASVSASTSPSGTVTTPSTPASPHASLAMTGTPAAAAASSRRG